MARVVIYDPGHSLERVTGYEASGSQSDYAGRDDVVIYAKGDVFPTLAEPQMYWRHDAGVIRDMDSVEKSALDAEIAAALLASRRDGAKAAVDLPGVEGYKLRAVVELMIREINVLRAQHSLADRTLAQAKAAYLALIDEGAADG
jgi:hypothetical protein